jgi:xanthine dehydrogenase molybdenum-binding subunit
MSRSLSTDIDSTVLGKRIVSIDGPEKVMGIARYLGDIELPKMLCGKILRSPYPHARILNIETRKAQTLPGVRAVITAEDTPKVKFGCFEDTKDQYMLATGKVRFIGEEVAAIAADNEEIADEAISLIKVEYDELSAVFEVEEALSEEAPIIHESANRNIAIQIVRHFNDVEKGFSECAYITTDEFETSAVTPACMETRGCVAEIDLSARIRVFSTNQTPHLMPSMLGEVLGIPADKFRIIQGFSGGAFGSKIFIDPIDPICILLALKAKRPVRLMLSREEDFIGTRMRHPMKIKLKTGVNKEGLIRAREVKILANNGAYSSFGRAVLNVALTVPSLMYKIPNLRLEGYLVYTNNPYPGAFQGFGNPQGTFASDIQMDMIAEQIGMDPIEFRLKNAVDSGCTSASDTTIVSCGICDCAQKATEASEWYRKRDRPGNRGIGAAFMVHPNSSRGLVGSNFADCTIKILPDGTVNLLSGSVDLGQGSATVLAQIAAEELGIPIEKLRVIPVDTDVSPPDTGTHATRVTLVAGNAIRIAAESAKEELKKIAAGLLSVNSNQLTACGGRIFCTEDPARGVDIAELARQSYFKIGKPIITHGHFQPETSFDPVTGRGNYSPTFSFACQIAEVEVDPETGHVTVVNFIAAHDVGRAINPMRVESQIEGGVCKGIGYALTEELIWERGKTLNPTFKDYRCITFPDMPEVKCILIETNDPVGPYGAKGVAEPALVATAPAIANAIYNAVGVRVKKLPISAESIVKAIRKQGQSTA